MPAHIYQRIGRYADASQANRDAIAADEAYMKKVTPWGYYPMYLGHNYGFLAYSASMQGRSAEAIDAAQHVEKALPPGMIDMMPGMDFFVAESLMMRVRFGKWDDIKAVPRPDKKYIVLTAFWLHAQGMAAATTGDAAGAQKDVDELNALADSAPPDLTAGMNPAKDVFKLAATIVSARIADKSAKPTDALPIWDQAVKMADQVAYDEPADWLNPVRHYQGAAMLNLKKYKDAEAVFREDLRRNPKNGWALFGLWKALEGEKKTKDAKKAAADFADAWKDADIKLTSPVF
jgi:tetratricopeptide (TPR) repeat protein